MPLTRKPLSLTRTAVGLSGLDGAAEAIGTALDGLLAGSGRVPLTTVAGSALMIPA